MISKSKGNQTAITSYYDPDTVKLLKALSEATRIPQSVYLREALDDLLKKYGNRQSERSRCWTDSVRGFDDENAHALQRRLLCLFPSSRFDHREFRYACSLINTCSLIMLAARIERSPAPTRQGLST